MLGVLCASIGAIQVTEAIKLITGIGEPLVGRLMVYDALEMTYRKIKVRKDPNAAPITELIDYEAFCGVVSEEAQQAAAGSTITAARAQGHDRRRTSRSTWSTSASPPSGRSSRSRARR